ncbi:MAG: hypothetical protein R2909_20305 [Gemmatimonadales bacterium]
MIRRRTTLLLALGLALALGTPAYLALSRAELSGYLLHPAIFALQAAPFALAGAIWLPRRDPAALAMGQWVAVALMVASAALYLPVVADVLPTGGDMIAMAFVGLAALTTLVAVVASLVAQAVLVVRRRRAGADAGPGR